MTRQPLYHVQVVQHGQLESFKPCPFCGQKPNLVEYKNDKCEPDGFVINHPCPAKDLFPRPLEEVLRVWNTRIHETGD